MTALSLAVHTRIAGRSCTDDIEEIRISWPACGMQCNFAHRSAQMGMMHTCSKQYASNTQTLSCSRAFQQRVVGATCASRRARDGSGHGSRASGGRLAVSFFSPSLLGWVWEWVGREVNVMNLGCVCVCMCVCVSVLDFVY